MFDESKLFNGTRLFQSIYIDDRGDGIDEILSRGFFPATPTQVGHVKPDPRFVINEMLWIYAGDHTALLRCIDFAPNGDVVWDVVLRSDRRGPGRPPGIGTKE